jgi:hypothetical protein
MAKLATSHFDPTIVDGASLFDAGEVIAERLGRAKVTLDYTKLRETLDSLRREHGWRPASLNTILLSVDPGSEGQHRFQTMVRHSGFEPDTIHFRDSFVSLPPGRSPSEMNGRSIVSLAPRLAYIAGLMARHADPHFLIVSHSFELLGPLTDLSERLERGKVGIAYFSSLLDYRWRVAGLLDGKLGIEFFDLDLHGDALLGVDLAGRPSASIEARAGLSKF